MHSSDCCARLNDKSEPPYEIRTEVFRGAAVGDRVGVNVGANVGAVVGTPKILVVRQHSTVDTKIACGTSHVALISLIRSSKHNVLPPRESVMNSKAVTYQVQLCRDSLEELTQH